MPKASEPRKIEEVRGNTMVSLRDVVLIMAGVVSIVAAWGLYGTRLTVVEERLVTMNTTVIELKKEVKEIEGTDEQAAKARTDLTRRLDKLEYDIESIQAQISKKENKKGR